MSPERDFMSAYLDGEIPAHWRDRFDQAIAEDSECRETFARHEAVHTMLQSDTEPDFAAAKDRVWNAIRERVVREQGAEVDSNDPASEPWPRRQRQQSVPVWKRRVSVPIPVAAAAAAVVVLLGAFVLVRTLAGQQAGSSQVAMAQSLDGIKVTVNVKDVQQLLDILNGQNKIREVNIELPSPHQFKLIGEPLLLRATDNPGGLR